MASAISKDELKANYLQDSVLPLRLVSVITITTISKHKPWIYFSMAIYYSFSSISFSKGMLQLLMNIEFAAFLTESFLQTHLQTLSCPNIQVLLFTHVYIAIII